MMKNSIVTSASPGHRKPYLDTGKKHWARPEVANDRKDAREEFETPP
jgi:hypothetical protein